MVENFDFKYFNFGLILDAFADISQAKANERMEHERKHGKPISGDLVFKRAEVDADYRKKWNAREEDFGCLYLKGIKVSDTLYRIGGIGHSPGGGDKYNMLLKHEEALYPDSITKTNKRHLASKWCILDDKGVEKQVFEPFDSPYLTGGVIYSFKGYHNIETGEFYCDGSTTIDSKEFLFVENKYDKDESRRGVFKINKNDGTYEIIE